MIESNSMLHNRISLANDTSYSLLIDFKSRFYQILDTSHFGLVSFLYIKLCFQTNLLFTYKTIQIFV